MRFIAKTHIGVRIIPRHEWKMRFSVIIHWLKASALGKSNDLPEPSAASARFGAATYRKKEPLGFFRLESRSLKRRDQQIHAPRILQRNDLGDLGMIEGVGTRMLDGQELPGIGIVLHIPVRLSRVIRYRRRNRNASRSC